MQWLPLENLTHVDGTSKILVCIWCGCPRPSISDLVAGQQGAESLSFVLTLVETENTGFALGGLRSLVLCHSPVFPRVFETFAVPCCVIGTLLCQWHRTSVLLLVLHLIGHGVV